MSKIQRYRAADLPQLMDKIFTNSLGLDDYFESFSSLETSNYPPYNIVHINNHESRLEVALAGFKKDEVNVYTEYGKLHVEGSKPVESEEEQTFIHRGLAKRNFSRSWTIAEDTHVTDVSFEDGLLVVKLGKVVPEHHARKDYLKGGAS
tara:strand:+ start:286 stop:732 length:447 start_codon:yes stop_codon:yes gene_type:complete